MLHDCGTGDLVQLTTTDEIVEIVLAGGSGYGDPRERSREAVERDIAQGYVTPEGARRDYGFGDELRPAAALKITREACKADGLRLTGADGGCARRRRRT